ncbi:MAG: SEL1-like repeat protein [Alistipes sp.]|nr:SEL1-like repeat protein [Alistipes sp.]
MKKHLTLLFALFAAHWAIANEDPSLNIAVFDPTSSGTSIDDGTRIAIREIISSTIVNTGKHTIVERSLLEKVMQEQQFTNSGIVAESDATEIGKMAGANKIILSVVTLTGGRNMLSIKMIDVRTANVDRQQVKVVTSGELLDVVEPMTLKVIAPKQQAVESSSVVSSAPAEQAQESQSHARNRSLLNAERNIDLNSNPDELYLRAQSLYSQGAHTSMFSASKSRQYRSKQEEAVEAYKAAADKGHMKAQFKLYELYKTGDIVEKDPYESFNWLRKAAESGHVQAQVILAEMYAEGKDLADKDPSQAIFWFEQAAQNGHNPSQVLMGDAYWSGSFGLEENLIKAVMWYELAAAKNAKLALKKGAMFEEGKEIEEDFEIAKRFYKLAARQGEKDGENGLERIAKEEEKRARKRR